MRKGYLLTVMTLAFLLGIYCPTEAKSEEEAKKMFLGILSGQLVYGYCPESKEELLKLEEFIKNETTEIPEKELKSSLKTLAELSLAELDWTSCVEKVIIYSKNFGEMPETNFFANLYQAEDNQGYGVMGLCLFKPEYKEDLFGEVDESIVKEANAPLRLRKFAEVAQSQVKACDGEVIDVYGRDKIE